MKYKNIVGTIKRPRISVFRSNRYTYAQAIDDEARKTIVGVSSLILSKLKDYKKEKKGSDAKKLGMELAKLLLGKKIESAVFDRGRYPYKGRIKLVAEGLREGGIKI